MQSLPEKYCLLIDDDQDDQDFFKVAISSLPFEVKCHCTTDGFLALDFLDQNPNYQPSYIFVDLMMPKIDGIECVKRLRNLPQLKNSQLYLYSSVGRPSLEIEIQQIGVKEILQKPHSLHEIIQLLNSIFEKN